MKGIVDDIVSVLRSKVVIILFGIGRAVIVARILGPEVNGLIAGLLVYPQLFMTIGALGIRKSSAFVLGSKIYDEGDVKSGILHSWILSVIFSIGSIILLLTFASKTNYTLLLILLAIAPIPFSLLKTYASGIYLGNNNIKEFNKVDWLPAVLSFFTTLLFVWVFPLSVVGFLIAEIAGPLIMAMLLIFKLRLFDYFTFKINFRLLKLLYGLGAAYAVSLLVINLNYRIDIVIMEWVSTKYELGIYSKGAVLTQYLWQVPMVLGTVVFARGVRAKDKGLFSIKVCQLLRVSLIITFFGCIFLGLLAKPIIYLLFGIDFLDSTAVMMWLLPGVFLLVIFKVLNMDMGSQGRPWFALRSMTPALIVNICLNLWLIPLHGARGAAIASTISYSLGALIFLVQYSNASGLTFSKIFAFSKHDFDFLLPYFNKVKQYIGS